MIWWRSDEIRRAEAFAKKGTAEREHVEVA